MQTKSKIVLAFFLGSLCQYLGTLILLPNPILIDVLSLDKLLVMYGYEFTSLLLLTKDTQLFMLPYMMGAILILSCSFSLAYYIIKDD